MEQNKTITIRELTTQSDWLEAYPVMHQLRTHLDETDYIDQFWSKAANGIMVTE